MLPFSVVTGVLSREEYLDTDTYREETASWEEDGPLQINPAWSQIGHLGLRFLASRTVRRHTSVV